jgi:DNA helicase-2/ATP-dependent DNA helicase PcrA
MVEVANETADHAEGAGPVVNSGETNTAVPGERMRNRNLKTEPPGLVDDARSCLSHLNPEQRAAATCGDGASLILAGPGTGKTTALVARYEFLVRQGVSPATIMAVTFTQKAAQQLKDRIGESLGIDIDRFPIGTFHALGRRLLIRIAAQAGLPPDFRILDEAAVQGVFRDLKIFWDAEDGGAIHDIVSRAKDELLTPSEFRAAVRRQFGGAHVLMAAADHYEAYQDELKRRRAVDFGDLIMLVVRAFAADAGLCHAYAGRLRHILVDEYQDINTAQHRLLMGLLSGSASLWAVGDDDQCLYGWRSARVGTILDFPKTFPQARRVVLSRNYRSRRSVVAAATNLIRHNKKRFDKTLSAVRQPDTRPDTGPDTRIIVRACDDDMGEADWIAGAVARMLADGIPPDEIAVLYRASHIATRLTTALAARGVPFRVRGGRDFWESPEVRAVVGLLRLTHRPGDPHALAQMGDSARTRRLAEKAGALARRPYDERCRAAGDAVAAETPKTMDAMRQADWSANAHTAARIAAEAGALPAFMEAIEVQRRALRHTHGNAVVLSTIHMAKGLEWAAVFIAGCEDTIMPHLLAQDLEEERRLAYVAMTRAKDHLAMSFAVERNGRSQQPSPYLGEAFRGWDDEGLSFTGDPRHDPRRAPVDRGGKDKGVRSARGGPAVPSAAPSSKGTVVQRRTANVASGRPARHGFAWSDVEDARVTALFHEGLSVAHIAREVERPVSAVQSHLMDLGLTDGD